MSLPPATMWPVVTREPGEDLGSEPPHEPASTDAADRLDPSRLHTVAEFAAALTSLRERAGLSIRRVSRSTGIPSGTIGGYFSGRHLPQISQSAAFAAVLTELGVPEADQREWLAAVQRLRQSGTSRPRSSRRGGGESPYRGLESYGVEDAAWFFGRDQAVEELVRELQAVSAGADEPRMVALVGASGSGKSSLLRAGLLARALDRGWTGAVIRPGERPVRALDETLSQLGPTESSTGSPTESSAGSSTESSTGPTAPPPGRLLVLDQLEELFNPVVSVEARWPSAPTATSWPLNVDRARLLLNWHSELTLEDGIASALAWAEKRESVLGYP